jgi:hypothetical protein
MNAKAVIDEMWELGGDLMKPHVEVTRGGERAGSRTGRLQDLSEDDVTKILGFPPENRGGSPLWRFKARIDGGKQHYCGIWEYKGHRFSTGGVAEVFKILFGDNYHIEHYAGPQGELPGHTWSTG